MAHQLYDNANQFFDNKKYFRAHIMYNAAIKQCPSDDNAFLSQIYTKLSATQFAMQKVDESIQSATKAIQADQTNSQAFVQRAEIFESSQNWRDALRDYQSALNINPGNEIYQNKVKFIEDLIEQHKQNSTNKSNEDDNEPIPRFTEFYAKDILNDMLLNGVRPSRRIATEIVKTAFNMISNLPNVVSIDHIKNIIIVGDVHGQFQDVAEIFKQNGFPSEENPYLFNGDFVDRGPQGIEILLTLFAFKIACPKSIYLNRGNQYVL